MTGAAFSPHLRVYQFHRRASPRQLPQQSFGSPLGRSRMLLLPPVMMSFSLSPTHYRFIELRGPELIVGCWKSYPRTGSPSTLKMPPNLMLFRALPSRLKLLTEKLIFSARPRLCRGSDLVW